MRESKNEIYVEGLVNEIKLKYGTVNNTEVISGTIDVRVDDPKVGVSMIVPVDFYANKFKRTAPGEPAEINKLYEGYEHAMNSFISVAAAATVPGATPTKVRIKGRIGLNSYYSHQLTLVERKAIQGTFITELFSNPNPQTSFNADFYLAGMHRVTDKDGVEATPAALQVDGVMFGFNGLATKIPFIVKDANSIDFIEQNWLVGGTYEVGGRGHFVTETIVDTTPVGFGDPIQTLRTVEVADFVITRGSEGSVADNLAYTAENVNEGMGKYQAMLARKKASAEQRARAPRFSPAPTSAPTMVASPVFSAADSSLGF